MKQHTPGPWLAYIDRCGAYSRITGPKSRAIATVYGHDARKAEGITTSERLANAALIAAAPDLLACLVEVTGDLEAAYDDGQGAMPTAISAAIHRARAAIAKAGGR